MKIGVDIGGTKIRAGLVDQAAVVRDVITEPCPASMGKEDILSAIIGIIGRLVTDEVDLIGFGVPAIVDKEGVVYECVNIPSWDRVDLKGRMESEFGIPVVVNNDCNCFVRGVARSSYGMGCRDIVGITLGTGVGAGLYLNEELYSGQNSCAGEIGCMRYKDKDYESYCSSQFFANLGTTAMDEAFKARSGDEDSLLLWKEFGENVGNLINMVTLACDPQVVMLGGGISSAFDLFEPSMRGCMARFPYTQVVSNIKIFSDPSGDFMLVGAVMC